MVNSSVSHTAVPRQSPKKHVAALTPPQPIHTSGNVALYMRVSSEDQAERGTIGSQRDFLRQFASLYSLSVVGEHEDDGVTGTLPVLGHFM
jgi:hypothetical protein